MLPKTEPVVLWISVHGADPEPGVPANNRRLAGTSGVSTLGEQIAWHEFFDMVKQANNPGRIIVLMDVCWGSSPTAPSRLASPKAYRPRFVFGPARTAYRHELDTASKTIFDFMIQNDIPDINNAKNLVDSINTVIPQTGPKETPFYRLWWWSNDKLVRYPEPPGRFR